MDLMDTMIGKWKIDLSSIENLDAYAAAMREYRRPLIYFPVCTKQLYIESDRFSFKSALLPNQSEIFW